MHWVQKTCRHTVISSAALAATLLIRPAKAAEATSPARTNVVVLLADDMGYGDPSCKGGNVPTPNMDRLLTQGVELQTFLVQPVCSPTRAALLTGRHPARVGVNPRVGEMMNPKETTLAEVYKSAGYSTALMGKWHLGYAPSSPNLKGFDLFYGFLGAATTYLNRPDEEQTRWMLNDQPTPDPSYSTDLIRDRSIRFIGENASHPFFLYVAFNAVHNPVESAQQYTARVPASITDEHARARAGMLVALDDAVGAIVKKIDDDPALAKRTIVVFFSDNGPTPDGSAGPFRGRKHTLYEGGVRSPAVVRWPGTLQAGKRSSAMMAVEDLFPTLLKMTDVALPKDVLLDGKDFSPCLTGDQPSPRDQRCWLWTNCDSIRTPQYKLIRFADHRELYDLQSDVAESKNLATERKELADELQKKLDDWEASVPIYPTHVPLRGSEALKAEPSGDVLELRATHENSAGGPGALPLGLLVGQCEKFPIRSGDRLEYDILIAADSALQGVSISISPPLNKKKAARGAAVKSDDDGPAASADTAVAVTQPALQRQWTRRALGLANFGGKSFEQVWLNIDAKQPGKYHVFVDNVVVRHADDSATQVYHDGQPHEQRRGFSPAYSDVSVKVVEAAKAQP